MPIDFRIPDNSAGNITVTVQAPLGGTLWNFSLVSGGFAPRNQRLLNNFSPLFLEELEALAVNPEAKAIQPESVINTDTSSILTEGEVYLEAEAIQPEWVVNTYTSSILTEGKIYDTGQAIRFTINRNSDTSQTEEIGWRVKPTGNSPISANDFESGTLPEGILTLLPNVQTTIDINFERLDTTGLSKEVLDAIGPINDYWGLKQDGLQEGEETWTIELFDPSTGNIIPASFNGSSVFSVRDDFFFVEPETGNDDGELLEGDNLSNIIFGSGGDDTINGYAGNDTLYGDNGDDIINGGIGDDIIDGGFGNDTIDGGAGNDTLRISRPQSKIALTKQSNSSYLLQDLSDVSLGIDVLKSIETIEFSDGTIQLDTKTEILGTSGRDELTGTSNSDYIIGLQGADKLTGDGGNDQFVYTNIRDRGDTITDFEVGKDNIVLTQLLDSLVTGGYNGTNAIADGYVKIVQGTSTSNFSVQIDTDGLAAGDIFRPFITVNLTNPGTLNSPSNFVF
jgi:Ca2+-binding RTX toxin-like protein